MALPHYSNINPQFSLSPVYKNLYECDLIGHSSHYSDIFDVTFKGDTSNITMNMFEDVLKSIDIINFLKDISIIYIKIFNKQGDLISHKLIDCTLINSTLNFSWQDDKFLVAFADFKMIKSTNLELSDVQNIKQIQRDLKLNSLLDQ